ncbi:MAG: cytochrome c3 family protein [Ignavibacteriales bacterium]|nr:cytochrome c3 family protein [Ignavibacteriales bacterium]
MKKIFAIFLVIVCAVAINAQQSPGKDHSKLNITCKTCHTCDVPTKSEPCLVLCPREKIVTVYQKPEQTPELIVIDQISDRYSPVYFSHRIHAQMSNMGGGCEGCHHFNTSGPILKCNSCHESSRKREDVSIPDLKGAYHRQCMDCHREWSHDTGCNTCHTPKKDLKDVKKTDIQKKYAGKEHPIVLEPTKLVYETKSDKGKFVTFYHDDHTKKFGLSCTTCHKQESCTKCHDVNKTDKNKNQKVVTKKTFEDQHKNCISCHSKTENCSKCHNEKTLEPFDHAKKTGWALNKYHINLSCVKCHGSKLPYKKVDNKCVSCHKDWNNETFKHSVTGLQLDETHSDFSCEDCHAENNYAKKPSCDGCHDGYSFPKQKPGKLVGK